MKPGENPRTAAVREVAEELGKQVAVRWLLAVDWAPHPDEGDKLLFVFDGGKLAGSVRRHADVQESEIAELKFAGHAELADFLPERLLHRILSSLDVPSDPYLEHGQPPLR